MPYVVRPGRSRMEARRSSVSREERRRRVLECLGRVRLSAYEVARAQNITFGYALMLLDGMECEGLVRSARDGKRRLWWVP